MQRQLKSRDAEVSKAVEDAREQLSKAAAESTAKLAELEAVKHGLLQRVTTIEAEQQKTSQARPVMLAYYSKRGGVIADVVAANAYPASH